MSGAKGVLSEYIYVTSSYKDTKILEIENEKISVKSEKKPIILKTQLSQFIMSKQSEFCFWGGFHSILSGFEHWSTLNKPFANKNTINSKKIQNF